MEKITSFSGPNSFLSNFHPAKVTFEGIEFPTSEHAFQAVKTLDTEERKRIAALSTPGKAKAAGKRVKLRDNWNGIRVSVMRAIVDAKFRQNPVLARELLDTGDAELIEGNTWNDTFWGVCRGKGQNWLGKILMEVRADLRNEEQHAADEGSAPLFPPTTR